MGTHTYQAPFTHEPAAVVAVLQQERPPREGAFTVNDADWYLQLALAHRSVVEDVIMTQAVDEPLRRQLNLAANAFQQAIHLYQGLRTSTREPAWAIQHHMAVTYFQLGETFSLDVESISTGNEYLVQSYELFRQILEEKQSPPVDFISARYVEVSWATCALRLGSNKLNGAMSGDNQDDVSEIEILMQQEFMQQQPDGSEVDWQDWLDRHPGYAERLAQAQTRVENQIEQAVQILDRAVTLFRKAVSSGRHPDQDGMMRQNLATALQNRGTAAILQGRMEEGIEYMEEAASMHQESLQQSEFKPQGRDAAMAVAEAWYSLADTYLQLGKYKESNERYEAAMKMFQDYSLPGVAAAPPSFEAGDETIAAYEQALQDYRDYTNDPSNTEAPLDVGGEQLIYQKDDGYEGDLYATLGSLYLMAGDYVTAESNLLQAIQLYSMAGEEPDRTTADAKFNLAAIYVHKGQFMESAQSRKEALDIYLDVVGEGVNPISNGVPELDLSAYKNRQKEAQEETPKDTAPPTTTKTQGDYETVINLEDFNDSLDNVTINDEL